MDLLNFFIKNFITKETYNIHINKYIYITSLFLNILIFSKINNIHKNISYLKYDLIDLSNTIKIVPFYIVLLLFSLILSYGSNIVMNKSYRIIDNDKVIVYTTNDYYLTLDCKIKNNELTIYKGKQSKINNEDVVSELINFDKVELK